MKTIKYLLVAVLFGTFLMSCETESIEEIAADNAALLEFDLQSKTSTGIVQNDPTADTGGDDDIPDPDGNGSTGGDDDIPDPDGNGSTGGDDDIPDPDGNGSTGGDDDIPDPDGNGSTGGDDDIPDPKA
jgi:hypothetical protein